MKNHVYLLIFNLLVLILSSFSNYPTLASPTHYTCNCQDLVFKRSEFPKDFVFGAGSAAYQVEGAWNISGKGPSIWDTFSHLHPEKIADRSNGDVATDSYHRYKEDVRAVKETNLDVYRFSISWSRLLPHGKVSKGVNRNGVRYYNNLIEELLKNGIQPCVTIFHWDVPQALEDLYGGFRSHKIVEDFVAYADLVFGLYGDRVKNWTTVNEPLTFSRSGYAIGEHAPGRCSYGYDHTCTGGDSGTEPYLVTHHQLLAHAATVRLYRDKYQKKQKGTIGLSLNTGWYVPYDDKNPDDGPQIALDFALGWFINPVVFGDYPDVMKRRVKGRLPRFTEQQKKLLRGSYDFIGLNYYTGLFAHRFPPHFKPPYPSYVTDGANGTATDVNGKYLGRGPVFDHSWIQFYPRGLSDLLIYIKEKYKNPPILITEIGMCTKASLPGWLTTGDSQRANYISEHICCLKQAMRQGSDVRGMIIWSLTDNYEWQEGYTQRFGLYYVDFPNKLRRIVKASAAVLRDELERRPSTAVPTDLPTDAAM